jgi:hypothetical protein
MKPRIQCVLTQWIPRFHASGIHTAATHPRKPEPRTRIRTEAAHETERNPPIHGKPFLTARNPHTGYAELPTPRTSPERIEGVSRSLPYSDLLALTSSHMFFSVMN